jgi:FkbM family methyltransferase
MNKTRAAPPLMALFALLEQSPGGLGRSFGRKLKRRMAPRSLAEFEARLTRIGPGDICLDLGANAGVVTTQLARTGAMVHAFEPDPDTFARLAANVGHIPNVTLHQKAVGARSEQVHLRRIKGFASDPARFSLGTSAVLNTPGQFEQDTIAVDQLGFRDLLASFAPGKVALIKMDIEGAEFAILQDILDGELPANFDALFVETHENAAREYRAAIRRYRSKAIGLHYPHIDLFWP